MERKQTMENRRGSGTYVLQHGILSAQISGPGGAFIPAQRG